MRGKIFCISVLLAVMLLFSSCVQVLNSPADEIRLYDWRCEMENGNTVTLAFSDDRCSFCITGNELSTDISGQCFLTDDTLMICDDESGQNYSFGYQLYGDRVELRYNGSMLTLKKVK